MSTPFVTTTPFPNTVITGNAAHVSFLSIGETNTMADSKNDTMHQLSQIPDFSDAEMQLLLNSVGNEDTWNERVTELAQSSLSPPKEPWEPLPEFINPAFLLASSDSSQNSLMDSVWSKGLSSDGHTDETFPVPDLVDNTHRVDNSLSAPLPTCDNPAAVHKKPVSNLHMQQMTSHSGNSKPARPQSGRKSGRKSGPRPRTDTTLDTLPQSNRPQLNPQLGDPRLAGRQLGDPRLANPQRANPQSGTPQPGNPQLGHPHRVSPQHVHPQHANSQRANNPQRVNIQHGNIQHGNPYLGNPQHVYPQPSNPQLGNPHVVYLQPVYLNPGDPQPVYFQSGNPHLGAPQSGSPQYANPQRTNSQGANSQRANSQGANSQLVNPQLANLPLGPQSGNTLAGYPQPGYPPAVYNNQGAYFPQADHAQPAQPPYGPSFPVQPDEVSMGMYGLPPAPYTQAQHQNTRQMTPPMGALPTPPTSSPANSLPGSSARPSMSPPRGHPVGRPVNPQQAVVGPGAVSMAPPPALVQKPVPKPVPAQMMPRRKRPFEFINWRAPPGFQANPENHGRWLVDEKGRRLYLNRPEHKKRRTK
ncbi:hypothetical protein N7466_004968 [Penicillium verhagenii]|uniref:uncharacterized protein n=1 Tax=Penicillium verhagenii TaxID=1562060 RepID=UPI002545603D|nr:uncharacterized protein N7466_004968 [Penicillium verhagenii]KAJ5935421.1 hypothetical protein N7466_004968 [Penicillium verhagenii]